ncbi:MAG: sigma-70 family RNA polymerase sigma factor [Muribaculaceae bacterium]|nr:sigma-70 family RNA polymerase sigma factor [Muribaculaceae bacterium]
MAYTPPIDEKELVRQLQDESTAAQAFDTLMRIYGEQMYWQIRRMVVSHDDANDLLQNAFVKVWQNLPNFRGDAKLSTWLFKIAVNESINFLNKERQRNQLTATDEEGDEYLLNNIEADPYFDGDALKAELQRAIASLPEKQRLVFNMRYFDEMKYEEISDVLGTSVGALKASYHHAVKKITDHISAIDG